MKLSYEFPSRILAMLTRSSLLLAVIFATILANCYGVWIRYMLTVHSRRTDGSKEWAPMLTRWELAVAVVGQTTPVSHHRQSNLGAWLNQSRDLLHRMTRTLGCLILAGLQYPGPLRGPPTAGPTLANLPSLYNMKLFMHRKYLFFSPFISITDWVLLWWL